MESLKVIKVGGAILEDKERLDRFIDCFTSLSGKKILIHGGGREATRVASLMGVESTIIDGRRVTDRATLDIVTMVYGGLVNKNVVCRLQSKEVNAIGLTGADARIVVSVLRPPLNGIDYGLIGEIESVNAEFLEELVGRKITPVIAPLSFCQEYGLLNTNADTMASRIAEALSAQFKTQLIYCFEKQGVLSDPKNEDTVIPSITPASFRKLLDKGLVAGGMIPKIENALGALKKGVDSVRITGAETLSDPHSGTTLTLDN